MPHFLIHFFFFYIPLIKYSRWPMIWQAEKLLSQTPNKHSFYVLFRCCPFIFLMEIFLLEPSVLLLYLDGLPPGLVAQLFWEFSSTSMGISLHFSVLDTVYPVPHVFLFLGLLPCSNGMCPPVTSWERTYVRYNFKIFHILKHLGSTHLLMVCINEEFQMKLFFFRIVMVFRFFRLLHYILLSSITIEKFWPFEFIPLFFSYTYSGSFFFFKSLMFWNFKMMYLFSCIVWKLG